MLVHVNRRYEAKSPGGRLVVYLLIAAFLMLPQVSMAADDALLDQLNAEAEKVEATGDEAVGSAESKADMSAFEKELEDHYRGSYLFYKKLPRRSQEEIFAEYAEGASIADIRKKIMNRFLHDK